MNSLNLSHVLEKAERFAEEGCRSLVEEGPLTPEQFRISPCPVSTALAVLSLLVRPAMFPIHIKSGVEYLEQARNPDGGWGRTPASPSDERSTAICRAALACSKTGLTPDAVRTAAVHIGAAWLQDVPRLILDWPPDSPLIHLAELFVTAGASSGALADISFAHLPVVLSFLPPGARPLVTALSCIHESFQNKTSRALQSALKKLAGFQSPDGSWCEDILITSLCILGLVTARRYPASQARGIKWLASVQYPSGAWPSFNQLTNWDVGLTAFSVNNPVTVKPELVDECARFLSVRAYPDGSFGTLAPYSLPDLDDTAIALLGINKAAQFNTDYSSLTDKVSRLLLSLQNHDGSWGTFPETTGSPPDCTCRHPVHIKSVDVSVHVLQSLLKSGADVNSPQVQKGLWWLAHRQKWDGSWKSTWYIGNTYATAQVLELLADCDIWPKSRLKSRDWLLAAQNESGGWPTGSAGECGLALTALLKNHEDPHSPVVRRGFAYISSIQRPDGSFKPFYAGLYASGLYYDDPITETLAVIRAIKTYQITSS